MVRERIIPPDYVQLHTHSNLSVPHDIVALASPEELVTAQKNKGYAYASLTDRDTFLGLHRFIIQSQKEEIKPIVGIEKLVDIGKYRRETPVLIYPKTNNALYALYPLVDRKKLTLEEIENISQTSFIITTGDYQSFRSLLLESENVYRGIHNTNSYGLDYGKFVEDQTGKSIITHEVRMTQTTDQVFMHFFLRTQERKNRRIPTNRLLEHSIKTPQEIATFYKPKIFGNMIDRTNYLAENINLSLPEQYGLKVVDIQEGKEKERLYDLVFDALTKREDVDQELLVRVQTELELINSRSLNNFILVCRDIVEFCKKNDIEFSTLGSGTNSVVLELLGIHSVSARDLDYTRFINPHRMKNPDIDFEIDDPEGTSSVKEYLFSKYNNFAALTLINNIREATIRKIIDETGFDITEEQVTDLDKRNIPWIYGTHPTAHAIVDNVPVWESHGKLLHQIEKDTVEDIVNLPTLDILKRAPTRRLTLIKKELRRQNVPLEIERNDRQTLNAIFTSGKVLGKSNLESPHMHNVLTSLGKILDVPNERNIAHALAVARTSFKGRERYLNNLHPVKTGLINYPEIGKILGKTNYTIFYQEQLSQIAVELAGLPPSTSEKYKKLMKDTVSNEEREYYLNLLQQGLLNAGYPEKIAKELIAQAKTINYSFVEGHAREMADKAYQLGFYAEKYPTVFWNAVFTHLSEKPNSISQPYTLQAYVNEALRSGIEFEFPDSMSLRDTPRLTDKKITIGRKMFLNDGNYEQVFEDINDKNLSRKQKIFSQLHHLGISFTASPIDLYDKNYHFDPDKNQQWIVGHIEGIKTNRNRNTGDVNSYFVVFESGTRLNVTLDRHIFEKFSPFLQTQFWYAWLVNNERRSSGLEINRAKPISEAVLTS